MTVDTVVNITVRVLIGCEIGIPYIGGGGGFRTDAGMPQKK